MSIRSVATRLLILSALALAACGQATVAPTPTSAPAATSSPATAVMSGTATDLSSIKTYLVSQTGKLKDSTVTLKDASDRYYELAKSANFDYALLWQNQRPAVTAAVEQARAAWMATSPLYEQMEGIVAGTPSLVQFDVDLDAGASGAEGGDSVVSFDVPLPNGTTLAKPGNLFGVTESTLWGTYAEFSAKDVPADFNGDGTIELGDALPDANILKGSTDLLDQKANELAAAAAAWQPTEQEAFGALVANVPTVGDFFEAWKNSRFVQSDPSKASRDFAAVSRLSDIEDNVTSWQTIYGGLSPAVVALDSAADQQIQDGLRDLKTYVADIAAQEQSGKRFTPEEADLLSSEAQNRATAITGQITQVAAQLNIDLNN